MQKLYFEDTSWMELAQDRVQQNFVSLVILNLQVPLEQILATVTP
jgi:hypothetical protein